MPGGLSTGLKWALISPPLGVTSIVSAALKTRRVLKISIVLLLLPINGHCVEYDLTQLVCYSTYKSTIGKMKSNEQSDPNLFMNIRFVLVN